LSIDPQVAPGVPVVLVVEKDQNGAEKFGANVVLAQPFTLQKLLNRIRPLLPAEDKNLLVAGPLELDMDQRWVRCQDRQTSLTPRLVNLLQILIKRKGEVIDRKELFRLVWDTGYTGDTRTLDVHISWLRQAVEEDPRHPQPDQNCARGGLPLDIDPDNGPVNHNSNHKQPKKPSLTLDRLLESYNLAII
jgi:DNA-binding response OmpR family regulator